MINTGACALVKSFGNNGVALDVDAVTTAAADCGRNTIFAGALRFSSPGLF